MAISYINSNELIVGASHSRYTDVKNEAGRYIDAQILVEHDVNGKHQARQTAFVGEVGSFTGNGVARTISLTNTHLMPLYLECFEIVTPGEMLTNGGFDTDTAGWTTVTAGSGTIAIASVAGGQSGNCCQITSTSTATGGASLVTNLTTILGHYYQVSFYLKSGTSGDGYNFNLAFDFTGGSYSYGYTSSGSWTAYSFIVPAVGTSAGLRLIKMDGIAGTLLVDTVSVTEIYAVQELRHGSFPSGQVSQRKLTSQYAFGINFDTGTFTIPAPEISQGINTSGETNYYYILGTDTGTALTGDSGAGTDPTWIVHGATLYGDGAGGGSGSSVEKHIEDAFLHEHLDSGVHTTDLFSGKGQIECGLYVGNGADSRSIELENQALIIKEIWIKTAWSVTWTRTDAMGGDLTKLETTAACATNYVESLGTGAFVVGTSANVNGNTYYYCAIGTR